ncbi:low-density lipoprotein receptor-related protein 8-like [Mytilus trossulus]|uniref:low-density lipoprotein receptor-related protein 8-like n=1 Tax=Mytilus trossulus TaxID=6551 RepID=UPI0030061C48
MEVYVWLCMCLLIHSTLHASCYSGKLLFSTNSRIMEFDFDTYSATVLLELGSTSVYAIDYDYQNRYIYFPRFNYQDIVRFAYPSKNTTLQTVVQSLSYPSGIAIDSANDHLYWIDYLGGQLSRCNIDGSNVTLLSTVVYPRVIRLEFTNRWMYIVEQSTGIMKSRFDLSERRAITNFTSTPVTCMDIDSEENRLYWINPDGEMKSCRDDGSDAKTILQTNIRRNYFAISVVGSYIYYENYGNQLLMLNKSSGSTPTVLYNASSSIHSIFVFNQSGMLTHIYSQK